MAASDVLKKEYSAIIAKLEQGKRIDYARLNELIVQMRAEGTRCGRLVLNLLPDRQPGRRVNEDHERQRAIYPDLPLIEWVGRKDAKGRTSQEVFNARYRKGQARKPAGVQDLKAYKLDKAGAEALAELRASSSAANKGNPFAEKLAALRG